MEGGRKRRGMEEQSPPSSTFPFLPAQITEGFCRPPCFLVDIKSFTTPRCRRSEKPKIASRAKGGLRLPKLLAELQRSQEKTQLTADVPGQPRLAVLQAPALPCITLLEFG